MEFSTLVKLISKMKSKSFIKYISLKMMVTQEKMLLKNNILMAQLS